MITAALLILTLLLLFFVVRRAGPTPTILVMAWLVFTALLSEWDGLSQRVPLVPLSALMAMVLFQRTARAAQLVREMPRHWPVAVQTFRIVVELAFLKLFQEGRAPIQVTFEGRNFDILVGLTAPLVALAIAKVDLAPRAVIAWNIAGLLILLNTVVTVLSSVPGPLHLNWPGQPFTQLATWPVIWIPAFLAPLAVALHVFSIRQNRGRLRS